jgi:hypothetical protein
MHPSSEIFARIQSLWPDSDLIDTPVFFSLADETWQQVLVTDLEAFYCHIRDNCPRATTIVTSYSVGGKPMLVAHYESASETCHRVWSVESDRKLRMIYDAPVEHIGRHSVAA